MHTCGCARSTGTARPSTSRPEGSRPARFSMRWIIYAANCSSTVSRIRPPCVHGRRLPATMKPGFATGYRSWSLAGGVEMRIDLLHRFTDIVGPPQAAVPLFDAAMLYSAALQDGDTWPEARIAKREIELAVTDYCVGREGPIEITEGVLEFLRRNRFR